MSGTDVYVPLWHSWVFSPNPALSSFFCVCVCVCERSRVNLRVWGSGFTWLNTFVARLRGKTKHWCVRMCVFVPPWTRHTKHNPTSPYTSNTTAQVLMSAECHLIIQKNVTHNGFGVFSQQLRGESVSEKWSETGLTLPSGAAASLERI